MSAVVVFTEECQSDAYVRNALSKAAFLSVITSDRHRFWREALAADTLVIAASNLSQGGVLCWVSLIGQHFPTLPLILITRRDPENARLLKDVVVDEVIWVGEPEPNLRRALRSARAASYRRDLASALRSSQKLSPKLRAALAFACDGTVPPRTVSELAQSAGCVPGTLWYHWRKRMGQSSRIRLEDFLAWLLLLAATILKVPGHSWVSVAHKLGVHEHTLARQSSRLLGKSLSDLAVTLPNEVASRLDKELVSTLLGRGLFNKMG